MSKIILTKEQEAKVRELKRVLLLLEKAEAKYDEYNKKEDANYVPEESTFTKHLHRMYDEVYENIENVIF